jgi:small-conductance mechanosensitive channel
VTWSSQTIQNVALLGGATLAGVLAGFGVRAVVTAWLARRGEASARIDALLAAAVRGPAALWGGIVGLHVGIDLATLPPEVERVTQRALVALVILSVTWAGARLGAAWVQQLAADEQNPLPSATLITNLVRILVLAVGLLVMLQTLGISVTPIITALGVGGLAVALALQDTLANLFAGVHILATRQIRPGDFVRIESGEEGYVQDVTWRNTTIRRLPNDLVIVPNAKLAGAVTVNYHLPEPEQSVLVAVGVSYDSDLARVEHVTLDVAREVQREVDNAVREFEPFVRYTAFADSSINFNVILRAREAPAQYLVRHEFIKRLHERYRRERIEIPFPQRTLHMPAGAPPAQPGADS